MMATPTFCSACGQALKAGARFCANCGASVMASVQAAPSLVALSSTPQVASLPAAGPPQYSADGRWWWNGAHWTAVIAPAPTPTPAVVPLRKNAFSLPPGDYTANRKWRLENSQWVATGKWQWNGSQYIRRGTSRIQVAPNQTSLKPGLLIFRDGTAQGVDANRQAKGARVAGWRATNAQAVVITIAILAFAGVVLLVLLSLTSR